MTCMTKGPNSLRDLPLLNMNEYCVIRLFARGVELNKEIGPRTHVRCLLKEFFKMPLSKTSNTWGVHLRCRRESWAEVLLILAGFGFAIASTMFW